MVTIVGYGFNAAVHCPECTRADLRNNMLTTRELHCVRDEHGIPEEAFDNSCNPVHPIFSTDEHDGRTGHCDSCRADLWG